MSTTRHTLVPPDWRIVADCVDEYESGRRDSGVDLRRFVEQLDSEVRRVAIVELVKVDLELRWQAGERCYVESYLEAFPEIGGNPSNETDLIKAEIGVRRIQGEELDLEDYLRRFPNRSDAIKRIFGHATAVTPSRSTIGDADSSIAKTRDYADFRNSAEIHLAAGQKFDRYEIVSRLGKGGMGSVYLAFDTKLDRKVALKTALWRGDRRSEFVTRFYREARAAATVHHPSVCPVFDVGYVDGVCYLTMAYIEGQSLREIIKRKELPEPEDAASLVWKVAKALDAVHFLGVVHRDVKPANIMINRSREPILVDFGLARRDVESDPRLTRDGAILGTPAYMSPEQIVGDVHNVGPRSDLYSLGLVLFELLTGRLPFANTLDRLSENSVPAPSTIRPDIDPGLDAICCKAISRKIEDRFDSAADFVAAIEPFVRSTGAGKHNGDDAMHGGGLRQGDSQVVASGVQRPTRALHKLLAWSVALTVLVCIFGLAWYSRQPTAGGQQDVADAGPTPAIARPVEDPSAQPAADKDLPTVATIPALASLELHLQRAEWKSGYERIDSKTPPLRVGDKVQVRASLTSPGYAYLYHFDAAGNARRLWPKDDQLQAQEPVKLVWEPNTPANEMARWYQLVEPAGTEGVVLAVSQSPLSIEEIQTLDETKVQFSGSPTNDEMVLVHFPPRNGAERSLGDVIASPKGERVVFNEGFQNQLQKFDAYSVIVYPLRTR